MRLRVTLVALVCVVPLWTTPAVPTQDGPSHLYNAWVVAHLHDPALGLGRHFELQPWAPNWGGVLPLVALMQALPPLPAETVFLSLLVVAFVTGAAALLARCGGDPLIAAALAGVVVHGRLFVMGFSGYLLALALGFFLAASAVSMVSGDEPVAREWGRLLAAAATLSALFFVHLLGALVAAGLWTLVVLSPLLEGRPVGVALRRTGPALALVPLLALHATREIPPVLPPFRDDARGPGGRLLELVTGFHWQALSDDDRLAGFGLTVLLAALLALRVRQGDSSPSAARALLVGAGASVLAFVFVPWAAGGGALLPERFVPLALLLPLAWATSGRRDRPLWRVAAFALLGFAVVLRGVQYHEWGVLSLRLAQQQRPAIAPGALIVAANWIDAGSVANPLFHAWARLALEARAVGLDDYEAAMPRGLFPVTFRPQTLELAYRSRSDIGAQPPPGVQVFGWER